MKKICSFQNCDRPFRAKGYCSSHYRQLMNGEELYEIIRGSNSCVFNECTNKHSAKGYCRGHYQQLIAGNGFREIKLRESNIGKKCEVSQCHKPAKSKGLCAGCYMRHLKYNISKDELINLNYLCEVCGDSNWSWLHIDHDHTTGKVRGVLCQPCNTSLGKLNEDVERIMKLATYIKRFKNV